MHKLPPDPSLMALFYYYLTDFSAEVYNYNFKEYTKLNQTTVLFSTTRKKYCLSLPNSLGTRICSFQNFLALCVVSLLFISRLCVHILILFLTA